ncbi:MAG: ATP-binding domain-containing protein [Desulfovibrio sp.]|nr:ATP-binding domain-containing protein [Desulfovibrio sp.]
MLEVKDWAIDQILEMDPRSARLRIGNQEDTREQPLAQARRYVNRVLSLLGKGGAPACPVTWGAALPNISRADWRSAGLEAVADASRIFFWDELNEHSPLLQDVSGAAFRSWLKEHFPPLFPFTLTSSDADRLRNLIFPLVRLRLPRRSQESASQGASLAALDRAQENAAKNLGAGNLLISGPAGSGKTLVLAARAAWLTATNKNIRRVLHTCFNLSLAGYIRRLISMHSLSGEPHGIEVLPFYMLCERIIGERLEHTSSDGAEYYAMVLEECLGQLTGRHELKGYWDAILVDEGQDFSAGMAQVILQLLPARGSLSVAQDRIQQLYQDSDSSWQQAGLREQVFERQYRNSASICRFAAAYLGFPAPQTIAAQGRKPEILEFPGMEAQIQGIANAIAALVRAGAPMGEIAILYFSSRFNGTRSLPEELLRGLESRGILARWLSRDASSKRFYDITTDSVTISTIHSAKGMDFANVFLAGFSDSDAENYRRLAYVGMTRARGRLFICNCAN